MRRTRVIFGCYYLVTATIPYTRAFVGSLPLYLADLLMIASWASFLGTGQARVQPEAPLSHSVVKAFLLMLLVTTVWGVLCGGTASLGLVYEGGRRALAVSTFFLAGSLAAGGPAEQRWLRALVVAGLLAHATLVVGQALLRVLAPGLLDSVDYAVYTALAQMPGGSRAGSLWHQAWYVPRAYGGYWNPCTAVAGLVIVAPLLLGLKRPTARWTAVALVGVAIVCTGSRQGIAVIATLCVAWVMRSRNAGAALAAVAVVCSVWSASAMPGEGDALGRLPARSLSFVEEGGVNPGLYSRSGGYTRYWGDFVLGRPELMILGRGVNFQNSLGRFEAPGAGLMLGFVSNSWLLLVAQQGLIAAGLFAALLWHLQRRLRDDALWACVIGIALTALFDNHMATMHFLQGVQWTLFGLACALPGGAVRGPSGSGRHPSAAIARGRTGSGVAPTDGR